MYSIWLCQDEDGGVCIRTSAFKYLSWQGNCCIEPPEDVTPERSTVVMEISVEIDDTSRDTETGSSGREGKDGMVVIFAVDAAVVGSVVVIEGDKEDVDDEEWRGEEIDDCGG